MGADRVALVTGGSRGIGRSIALRLAREKFTVVINYVRKESAALEVVRAIVDDLGGTAVCLRADLGDPQAIAELFAALDDRFGRQHGGRYLDVLVNNAGIPGELPIDQTRPDDFDAIFAVNARGPFLACREAIDRLRDGGRIVNVSSVLTRVPVPEAVAYSMSKGALDVMTRVLAAQLGRRRITVNAVSPGITDTDVNAAWLHEPEGQSFASANTALGRPGTVEDVADVVALLVSHDGRWITGQVIDASGGFRL
ncbi:SDR family oxidoreductase [Streptomyces sp. NPDC001508]|uniref:SDR family NAD(P)-dependent oxidoreductase n=1 Tax=Streptomyces sp. NPDC001508 TaxID=3154656 RepID=UPI00332E6081